MGDNARYRHLTLAAFHATDVLLPRVVMYVRRRKVEMVAFIGEKMWLGCLLQSRKKE